MARHNGFPAEIMGMRLKDLFQSDDVSFTRKGNKERVVSKMPEGTLSVEYTKYPHGAILSASKFASAGSKKDMRDTVIQLYREGNSQAKVAELTGMTQSYVSKIINGKV